MERIYIGMGSNLAAPDQQLRSAIEALAQLPGTHVAGVSAFYQSDSLLPGHFASKPAPTLTESGLRHAFQADKRAGCQ